MIFVTVGAQMPFDRLVQTVDDWAGRTGRSDVFAQIGETDLQPKNIHWTQFLDSEEFHERFHSARTIVAHAGMGTIITALVAQKSILVMPRRGDLRETRNDHQVATAKRFLEMGWVTVAFDEKELVEKLDAIENLQPPDPAGPYASEKLIAALREFIDGA